MNNALYGKSYSFQERKNWERVMRVWMDPPKKTNSSISIQEIPVIILFHKNEEIPIVHSFIQSCDAVVF